MRIDVRMLISAFAGCLHNVNVEIWLVFQPDYFILNMVKIKLTVILMECLSINIRNETNHFTEYAYTFNSSRLVRQGTTSAFIYG